MVIADRHALGIGKCLLKFRGEPVETHRSPVQKYVMCTRWGALGGISMRQAAAIPDDKK
jgi:hypothetical protein